MSIISTKCFYLRLREDGFIYGGVDYSSCLIFLYFFRTTNLFSEDSVRYAGFKPMTEGMVKRRVLRSEFMVVSEMSRIGTIPVWTRKQFH